MHEGVATQFQTSAAHIMDQPDAGNLFNTAPSFMCDEPDFLASVSRQVGEAGLLDPGLEAQNLGIDASNDLFKMWANVPLNFRFVDPFSL